MKQASKQHKRRWRKALLFCLFSRILIRNSLNDVERNLKDKKQKKPKADGREKRKKTKKKTWKKTNKVRRKKQNNLEQAHQVSCCLRKEKEDEKINEIFMYIKLYIHAAVSRVALLKKLKSSHEAFSFIAFQTNFLAQQLGQRVTFNTSSSQHSFVHSLICSPLPKKQQPNQTILMCWIILKAH